MIKSSKKQFKQQKSLKSESMFENFCQSNNITYKKLDDPINQKFRNDFLKMDNGKCPDFWCQKDWKQIFVEVKTLTNLTNQKREDSMDAAWKELKSKWLSHGPIEVFNPIPEIQWPFTTFLKDTSKKFKNIKDEFDTPRVLFLNWVFGNMRFTTHAIFIWAYDSYAKGWIYVGMRKKERGLFDKTGSSVSGIIYWDDELNCFCWLENPKTKFPLSEDIFKAFFEEKQSK